MRRRLVGAVGGFALGAGVVAAFRSPWRTREYPVVVHGEERCAVRIHERRSPPPIGGMVWPASQVLLHWALDTFSEDEGAVVLEMGSGCGLTAIGLALASPPRSVRSVLATDSCATSLANCEANVRRNGAERAVRVAKWDIIDDVPPCDVQAVTHVLAADVVYHGACGEQLVKCLVRLLAANPRLDIALILVDRFSGGGVSALSAMAGVPNASVVASALDPAVEAFERAAAEAGLKLVYEPLGEGVAKGLTDSMPWWERLRWMFLGHWDAMRLYRVRAARVQSAEVS